MAVSHANATQMIEKKKYRERGGKVDMCKALEDWMEEERMLGIEQGIEQGIEALIMDNLEEGKSVQCIMGKLEKRFCLSEEKAQKYLEKYL